MQVLNCSRFCVHAGPSSQRQRDLQQKKKQLGKRTGFFSDADPNAEVRPATGFLDTGGDYTKRGGRWNSDFVWNTNWEDQLDRDLAAQELRRKREAEPAVQKDTGFLSFNRLAELNSMDVDLSQQLQPRQKPEAQASQPNTSAPTKSKALPTAGDMRRWERSGKFAKNALVTMTEEVKAAQLVAEQAAYDRMKLELQLWTIATSLICCGATWAFYSQDTALSYSIGAAGSFLYLRLLNRTMDTLGGSGGLMVAVGQPRLLIPIILALVYNRWNHVAVEKTGISLQLMPILLGFFTYKAAVVGRQGFQLLRELSRETASDGSTALDGEDAAAEADAEQNYVRRVLSN